MLRLSATTLRSEVEGSLAKRFPSAFTMQPCIQRPLTPTGIADLDDLLGGGIPVGAITEVVGTACSGRTTLAMSAVASVQRQDHYTAWIDCSDLFDPESAAANGVALDRMLWVRCGVAADKWHQPAAQQEQPMRWVVPGKHTPLAGGGNSPHPRSEARGMTAAIGGFLHQPACAYARDKTIATPGVRNLPLRDKAYRKEQVNSDRRPARRGSTAGTHRVTLQKAPARQSLRSKPQPARKPWNRIEQALRAADILLGAGGFGLLVMDFSSITPEAVNRVPLATWFRFRAAAEHSRTAVLLLTQHSSARSSAEVLLETRATLPHVAAVMPGLAFETSLVRQRFKPQTYIVSIRKPSQPDRDTSWSAKHSWAGAR